MVAANRADVAFALQTAKGAAAATSAYRTYIIDGRQPGQARTQEDFEETTGDRMRSSSYVSEAHVDGSPKIFAMPKSLAAILYAVLGATTPTGAVDPFLHTATPASTLPYLTFWRWLADLLYEKSVDCKIPQVVIHGESGKPLTITATVMGLTPSSQTAHETAAAVEVTQRFMHYDGAAALQIEGAAVSHIRSFDLTINNNGQIVPGDALTPYDVAETMLDVMLRTTQLVVNASLWNRIHYGTASPTIGTAPTADPLELAGSPAGIDFKWTRVAAAPGPERSLEILIPRVVAQPFDIQPATGAVPLTQEVSYRAFQPAAGASITAKVKNGQATVAV